METRYNVSKEKYNKFIDCVHGLNDVNKAALILELCNGSLDFYSCSKDNRESGNNRDFIVYNPKTSIWEVESENQVKCRFINLMSLLFKSLRPVSNEEIIEHENRSKEFKSKWAKIRVESGNMKFYKDTIDIIRNIKYDESIFQKLDKYRGKLQFQNGALNLETFKLEPREKDDFITKCLPYDMDSKLVSKKLKSKLKKQLMNITNSSEDNYKTLMSWIAYMLIGGNPKQLFGNLYGPTAGNGKSTIIHVLNKVFGFYIMTMDSQTFNVNYQKKHKVLIGVGPETRICTVEEPKGEQYLDITLLKDFSSASKIQVEILYGTTKLVEINCVLNFISNYVLRFNTDNGMQRRGVVFNFHNKFVEKDEVEQAIKNGHDRNRLFVKDEFFEEAFSTNKYKINFISLLHDVIKEVGYGNIHNLQNIKDEWKTNCELNDNFYEFLDSTFEITRNNTDFVTKDLFLDYYKTHHKISSVSLATLMNHLKKNNLVYDRFKMISGKRGVIYGLKIKKEKEDLFHDVEDDADENNFKAELDKKDKRIAELEKLIQELQNKVKKPKSKHSEKKHKLKKKKLHEKKIIASKEELDSFFS